MRRADGQTLWGQIAGALELAIKRGDYRPGQQLPTEKVLAERFGVNRHTVRQAMNRLGEIGLVSIEQGRGMFVAESPLDYALGPRTRFSENLAIRQKKARRDLIEATRELANAEVARALQLAPRSPVWRIETLNRADERAVSVTTHWIPAERFPDFPEQFRRSASITAAFKASGIPDYRRKWTRVSARIASSADARALGLARNRPVLLSENVNIEEGGRPIEYNHARFVADHVSLTIEHG